MGEAQPAAEHPDAAVVGASVTYYWQPMRTCTSGRHVQLLSPGAIPVYSKWDGKDAQWLA